VNDVVIYKETKQQIGERFRVGRKTL